MIKKLKNKWLVRLACTACLFGACGFAAQGAVVANAETSGSDNPSVTQGVTAPFTQGSQEGGARIEIVAKNLSYSDSIYILYAVDFDGFDESQNEVKMLFWDSVQDEYTVETAESVKSSNAVATVGGRECIVFYSDGIAAKEMNDMVYCRAYANVDGGVVYSEVQKYSVVDYVYEKRAEGGLTSEQTAVFADMLDYGSSAQKLFNYNKNSLANSTYYIVTVENGVLEDGFTWGRYALNDTATITANAPADGYEFLSWVDETGATVAETETVSILIYNVKNYAAQYEKATTPATAFEYSQSYSTGEITINKYVGEYTNVVIPSRINNKAVTKIGDNAFNGCDGLTNVEIPTSITTIGYNAFAYCSGLTYISIPNSVTLIDDYAFYRCTNIECVDMGESVTSIGANAFEYCTSLVNINFPKSLTTIEHDAFYRCSSLTTIEMKAVTTIGSSAFSYCTGLTSLDVGNALTNIPSAFSQCSNLTKIVVGESVTTIDSNAFSSAESVTEVIFNAKKCEDGSFFIFSNGGTAGENLHLVIGKNVTQVPAYLCYYNNVTIELGDSVKSIGRSAFGFGKKNIYISNIATWCNISGLSNIMGSDVKLYLNSELLTNLVIPDGVSVVRECAFYCCTSLKSVEIPYGVTNIGNKAFQDCTSLISVNMANDVKTIGDYAFDGCSGMTSIKMSEKLTGIGKWAFYGCWRLKKIEIPATVNSIGEKAFYWCSSLTIYCAMTSQPSGWNANWNYEDRPVVWGYKGEE